MRYKHTCTSFFFCLWCLPQDRLLNLGVPLYRSDGPQKTRKMHCSFRLLANSPVHQHNNTEVPPVDRTTCAMHLQEITISFSNALVVIKAKFFIEFLEINRLFYKVPNILLLNSHTGDITSSSPVTGLLYAARAYRLGVVFIKYNKEYNFSQQK